MAGSKTDYAENALLNLIFRGNAWTAPTVYIGLLTGTLTGDTPGTEVAGGSYARVAAGAVFWGPTTATANDSIASVLTNVLAITFPSPTANWGTVTHIGVFNASTAGNALYYADLAIPRTINNGDGPPSLAIGAVVFTED